MQLLGSAADDNILPPQPDHVACYPYGVQGRCAGSGCGHHHAVKPQVLRHIHGYSVRHALEEHCRVKLA